MEKLYDIIVRQTGAAGQKQIAAETKAKKPDTAVTDEELAMFNQGATK
jgi:hypothetical protein